MLKVRRTGKYEKMFRILVFRDPKHVALVDKKIKLFLKNPLDTRLRSHKLIRHMKGKCAFSITDDIRIVYKWQGRNIVRFLAIGTHPEVYKK